MERSTQTRYLYLVAAAACWGLGTVLSKRALHEMPALVVLSIQLIASVALLGPLASRTGGGERKPEARLGALGLLNPGVSYSLGLVGLSFITASLSVVLWATEPLMILLFAAWLLRERVSRTIVLVLLVALVGVGFVVVDGRSRGSLVGIVLSLVSVATCAVYTIAMRKWHVKGSTLGVISVQQQWALAFALLLLGGSVLATSEPSIASWSVTAWASAALSGVLYYAIAFWLYVEALRQVPAAVAGTFLTLIPVFGVASGYLLLNDRFTPRQAIGALLIVGSVGALVWHRSRSPLTGPAPSIIVDHR